MGGGAIGKELRICELSQIKTTLKNKQLLESKEKELLELFSLFFTHQPKPINTALEFANALALRTQILKGFLTESQKNAHIANLYETFKGQLYKELDFEQFADSFAQTLTYALFLARLNNAECKELDLYNAKKFIPKSFSLIRAMSDFLNQLQDLESIQWLLEEIIHIINHIDIASIIHELNQTNEKDDTTTMQKDAYLHFYETFLSQYDPKLREIRGVYYTPASVVHFIVNAIDSTLKAHFDLQNGLGASLENQNITLLDFAAGTGTFLLEAFRKALESIPKNSPRYEPKKLLEQFSGLEFLIAPYTIAHLKLSQSFKEEFDAPLQGEEKLKIYLTNTLYIDYKRDQNKNADILKGGIPELIDEAIKAQNIKENAILIITGNPPYSGASANKGLFKDNVRITYGLEPSDAYLNKIEQGIIQDYLKNKNSAKEFKGILERKKLKNEKNPKWLLDDYVKFICFAESKIKEQDSGIFAFISNNAFLDNPTFRGMRYSLLKTFDKIYILDLHGNARKKECAPDGSKDENVFDIMQGVSINIFIKNTCHSERSEETQKLKDTSALPQYDKKDDLATLYHYDLYGKRGDKTKFLYANTLDSVAWATLKPQNPFYLFIPQNDDLRVEYDKGWSVKDIFGVSSVGVVTGKDSVLIASNEKNLESQVKDFYNEFDLKFVKEIAYRPFDMRKIYYDISKVTRPRLEVMQHFLPCHSEHSKESSQNKRSYGIERSNSSATKVAPPNDNMNTQNNKALLVSRQSSAVGDDEINTIAITDKIVDINFYRRGGEQVMPLYLKNTESSKDKKIKSCHTEGEARSISQDSNGDISPLAQYDKFEWIENFTPEFRSFIDTKYQWSKKEIENYPAFFKEDLTLTPEAILGYIYAVLFHKDYRTKYIDFFKIDFPKIPFVESKEKFLTLSALGQELINTHLMQDSQIRERERENRN